MIGEGKKDNVCVSFRRVSKNGETGARGRNVFWESDRLSLLDN